MPRLMSLALAVLFCLLGPVSPGRAERNLTRPPGTTRYAPMVAELKSLLAWDKAHGEGRMQMTSLGHSVQGRDIWMVTLHEPDAVVLRGEAPGLEVLGCRGEDCPPARAKRKSGPILSAPAKAGSPLCVSPGLQSWATKRLFALCRQHGHEPASTEGALAFIRDLVKAAPDAPLVEDLKRVTVSVVPMANPDGAEAFRRHNAHNVDLNRDWLRRTQPETRAWYRAIQTLHPDLMTDQHELFPDDPRPDFTETAGVGCGARPDLIAACGAAQAVVQASMGASGFPVVSHTITDHHPARLAHRYGCVVAGIPTILFETNRFQGSGRDVAARARAHEQFLLTVLRDLAGEGPQILSEAADRQMLLASRQKPYQRGRSAPVPDKAPQSGTKDGE